MSKKIKIVITAILLGTCLHTSSVFAEPDSYRIEDTFVESYDFTDKTVIPFCTSISSGIGSSANTLASLAGNGDWMSGQSFGESEDADTVIGWARQYQN